MVPNNGTIIVSFPTFNKLSDVSTHSFICFESNWSYINLYCSSPDSLKSTFISLFSPITPP